MAVLGNGTKLHIGDIRVGSVPIADVRNIKGPNPSADVHDIVTLADFQYKRKYLGMKNAGSMSIDIVWDQTDNSFSTFLVLSAWDARPDTEIEVQSYTLVFPDSKRWLFRAHMSGLSPAISVDDVVMMGVDFEVTQLISFNV